MNKEEYKIKKLGEFTQKFFVKSGIIPVEKIVELESFISQTIDELIKLPKKKRRKVDFEKYGLDISVEDAFEMGKIKGWNSCISEVERLRDLSIKPKK